MWVKILNPQSLTICPVVEMEDFFEKFARGKTLSKPTLVSDTFAKQMIVLFRLENLMVDVDRIDMVKLRQCMEDGTFSPQLFNQMIKNDCSFEVSSVNHTI